MKYYTVYKTTNKINGKTYIGKHKTENSDNDSYMGSGKLIKRAFKKYGKENFKKEILFFLDNYQDMNDKEKEVIAEEDAVADPNSYNLKDGGEGGFDHINNDSEFQAKRSTNTKEQWQDKEKRAKLLNGMKEAYKRPEVKASFSAAKIKKWQDEEFKLSQSLAIKEALNKPEVKIKKSEIQKQIWQDKEYQIKRSVDTEELWQDKEYRAKQLESRRTPECRAKHSAAMKGRICITDGEKVKMIHPNEQIPDGFVMGRKIK